MGTTLPNIASINNYGSGVLTDAVPLVDPTSELGAAALNPLRNDCSAMTATATRLVFQFAGSATAPALTSSATWTSGIDSVWGNAGAYNPTLTRTGTGLITVQLPSTVQDQIGSPSTLVNIRFAECVVCSGTTPANTICNVTSSSTFTIRLYNTGTLSDFVGALFTVKVT